MDDNLIIFLAMVWLSITFVMGFWCREILDWFDRKFHKKVPQKKTDLMTVEIELKTNKKQFYKELEDIKQRVISLYNLIGKTKEESEKL